MTKLIKIIGKPEFIDNSKSNGWSCWMTEIELSAQYISEDSREGLELSLYQSVSVGDRYIYTNRNPLGSETEPIRQESIRVVWRNFNHFMPDGDRLILIRDHDGNKRLGKYDGTNNKYLYYMGDEMKYALRDVKEWAYLHLDEQ